MVPSGAKVVIADPIDPSAVEHLRAAGVAVVDATSGADALVAALPDAWALVVRSRTRVTAELLGHANRLALVARAGVGVDNVDVPAASAKGIRVVNAPGAATGSVAELTIGLYLALARDLVERARATRAGEWKRGELGFELSGKTVGFIGYGRIAREIARRLQPFRVRTMAFDPFVATAVDATEIGPIDAVLAGSDIVSVHAALTPENHHLLNATRLAQMKRGAYLVNVARGALVDETALLAALDSGQLAGAALDVFETEPPTGSRLLGHPRVIPTPHIGASTREAQKRAGVEVADEILRAIRGERLSAVVNPEVAAR